MKGTHSDHNEFPEPTVSGKTGNKKNRPLDKEQGDKTADTSAAGAVEISPFGKVSESEFVEAVLVGTDSEVLKLAEHLSDDDVNKLLENENCSTAMKRVQNVRKKVPFEVKKEDVDLLFSSAGVDLSEEFTTKAFTLFEGAVSAKVESLRTGFEAELSEAATESQNEYRLFIEERLDTFLDMFVEEFMTKNEIAITNGIKQEFAEQIGNSVTSIIESFGVELSDEKVDVAESLSQELLAKEAELNESIESVATLRTKLRQYELKEAFSEVASDLTDVDREKLSKLAENISYENVADYRGKVNTLKESLNVGSEAAHSAADVQTPASLTEEKGPLSDWQKRILLAARGEI